MPTITDWLMVGITLVYVIATIAICRANINSAKATREQVAETKKQFEEEHRAFVTVTFEIIRGGLVVLHIENHGRRVAKNVQVAIPSDFIENLPNIEDMQRVRNLCSSSFTLGIGQSWYIFLGSHIELKKMGERLLDVVVSYKDSFSCYKECSSIDLNQYSWPLIYDSPTADIYREIKNVTKSLQGIDKAANKIQKTMEIEKTQERE